MFRHSYFQTQQVRAGRLPQKEVLKPFIKDGCRYFEPVMKDDIEVYPSMLDYSLENLLAAGIPLQEIPMHTLDMGSMPSAIENIINQTNEE